jgi:hypothetical protein
VITDTPSPSSTRWRVPFVISFVSDDCPSGDVYAVRIVTTGGGGGGAGASFGASGLAGGFAPAFGAAFLAGGFAGGFCVAGGAGGFCASRRGANATNATATIDKPELRRIFIGDPRGCGLNDMRLSRTWYSRDPFLSARRPRPAAPLIKVVVRYRSVSACSSIPARYNWKVTMSVVTTNRTILAGALLVPFAGSVWLMFARPEMAASTFAALSALVIGAAAVGLNRWNTEVGEKCHAESRS